MRREPMTDGAADGYRILPLEDDVVASDGGAPGGTAFREILFDDVPAAGAPPAAADHAYPVADADDDPVIDLDDDGPAPPAASPPPAMAPPVAAPAAAAAAATGPATAPSDFTAEMELLLGESRVALPLATNATSTAFSAPGPLPASDAVFAERVARSTLARLEQRFVHLVRSALPLPLLPNTVVRFRDRAVPAAADAIADRLAEYEAHAFAPAAATAVAVARYRMASGRAAEALAAAGRALERAPGPADAAELRYLAALACYRLGRDGEALAALGPAAAGREPGGRASFLRGAALARLGRTAEAATALAAALGEFEGYRPFLAFSAPLFAGAGLVRPAERAYRALAKADAGDPAAAAAWRERLALFLYAQESFARALPALESLRLSTRRRLPAARLEYLLGVVYAHLGHAAQAAHRLAPLAGLPSADAFSGDTAAATLAAAVAALHGTPHEDDKLLPLAAELALRAGDHERAVHLVAALPSRDRVALVRARCYTARGRQDLAVALLERAEIAPAELAAVRDWLLAEAYAALGRDGEAVARWRAAGRAGYRAAEAAFRVGEYRYRAGDFRGAAVSYRAALQGGFEPARAAVRLAFAARKAGMGLVARAAFQEAVRLDPANAEAHNNLGILLAEAGAHGEAVRSFKRALAADPGHREAHYNLGLVYEKVLASRSREHLERYAAPEA